MRGLHILIFFYILHLAIAQIIPCSKGCSGCANGTTTCSACPENFQLNTQGECIPTLNNNCAIYSVNSAFCDSCQPTFRSQNGTCIKDISGCIAYQGQKCIKCGFGKNLVNGSCSGTLNCLTYNKTICTGCQSGYFLNKNICYTVDTRCQRIDYSNGACIKCAYNYTMVGYQCVMSNTTSKNCYIFNQDQCLICKNGYILINSTCIIKPNCANNYYLNPAYKCVPLPQGCKYFDQYNSGCKYCNPNHLLVNGTCVATLPDNCTRITSDGNCASCSTNFYSFNYSCKAVSPYCKSFNDQGKCLSCKISTFVNLGGFCKDPFCANMTEYTCLQCLDNFRFQEDSQRCVFTDPNCVNLTESSCLLCFDGYYISYDICKPLPADCLSASKSGACLECQQNYYLQFDACFPTFNKIQNCRIYSQITSTPVCTLCQLGYFVSLGKCLQIPPFCNLILSNGNCVTCFSGYKLVSNTCASIKKNSTDPNCANMTNNTCFRCNSNSVLGINGYCYPLNNITCLSYDSKGLCLICQKGSIVSRGICISTYLIDINCKAYNKNDCHQCYQGFYLSNNQCKLPNTNCSSYNMTNGGCLSCYPGFTLTNQQCVIISSVKNCLSYDSFGNCLQCSHMYYISNNVCYNVSPLCQNYNAFNGDCTSCFPGYALKGKTCIVKNSVIWSTITNVTAVCLQKRGNQCISCPFRYYLRDNVCILVSSSCATYNTYGNCLTCSTGYFLKNDNCINYGTLNGTDPNCKTFQQQSFCLQCYNGFVSIQGACQSVDPLCRTYDITNGHCTSCYEGYILTSGTCSMQGMQMANPCLQQNLLGQCIQCISTYYLSGSSCLYNQTAKTNNYNIPFCQNAFNSTFCNLCKEGFYPRQGICYQVSTYCQTYNPLNGSCLTCKPNYIFQSGSCLSPAMGFDSKCQKYTSAYCSECVAGYYLKDYFCTLIDPRCQKFNYDVNQCIQCSSGTPIFDICQ